MNDIQIARWFGETTRDGNVPTFIFDQGDNTDEINGCHVVAPDADRTRIEMLFALGARQVLIGEAALTNSQIVHELVQKYGSQHIGIWLPVRRTESQWNLDCKSNADFNFVSISNPLTRWMVLKNDGHCTDVDAIWWAGEMLKAGCSTIVVSVNEPHDDDLLACAEMSEIAGKNLWLNTDTSDVEELRFWVKYGHAQHLVVPEGSNIHEIGVGLQQHLTLV